MGRHATATCEERLEAYIGGLASVIGHADRVRPLHDYCVGLMLPVEKNSSNRSEAWSNQVCWEKRCWRSFVRSLRIVKPTN